MPHHPGARQQPPGLARQPRAGPQRLRLPALAPARSAGGGNGDAAGGGGAQQVCDPMHMPVWECFYLHGWSDRHLNRAMHVGRGRAQRPRRRPPLQVRAAVGPRASGRRERVTAGAPGTAGAAKRQRSSRSRRTRPRRDRRVGSLVFVLGLRPCVRWCVRVQLFPWNLAPRLTATPICMCMFSGGGGRGVPRPPEALAAGAAPDAADARPARDAGNKQTRLCAVNG